MSNASNQAILVITTFSSNESGSVSVTSNGQNNLIVSSENNTLNVTPNIVTNTVIEKTNTPEILFVS